MDFVNPPIAVGHEAVHAFATLQTSAGTLRLLSPTDCVKDRLAAFFYWNDMQALEQAVLVGKAHQIDYKDLKKWAQIEGHIQKFKEFLKEVDQR